MKNLSKLARRAPKMKPKLGRTTYWTPHLIDTVKWLRKRGYTWPQAFNWLAANEECPFANYESLRGSYNSRK